MKISADIGGGNPDFNLNQAEPVAPAAPVRAMAALTEEDLAFDRELDRIANEEPPIFAEDRNMNVLTKEKESREMLGEFVEDYHPAATVNELMDQVHVAKEVGANCIEATPAIVRHYCRKHFPDDVGYFMFHDIKVFIAGFWETHKDNDKISIDEKLFGKPKVNAVKG